MSPAGRVVVLLVAVFALAGCAVGASVRVRAHAASRSRVSWLVGRGGPMNFQAGTCVEFAPVGRWNGRTVFLDPGHGGVDTGAVTRVSGVLVAEKRMTLALAVRTLGVLRRAGYRVAMSRLEDSTVARLGHADRAGPLLSPGGAQREIAARNVCADAAHANVLLGIHLNAYHDPAAGGTETIYCAERPFGLRSRQLAILAQRALRASLRRAGWSVPDRGVRRDRNVGAPALSARAAAYGHLFELGPADPPWFRYASLMPGVIVEPLFLTNPAEARIALSTPGQLAIARGLLDAVTSYFRS